MKSVSIIIPTYGRTSDVILRTIKSIIGLTEEFENNILEIVLIDQNFPSLNLENDLRDFNYQRLCAHDDIFFVKNPHFKILHFYGLKPSVTIAKNFGINQSSGQVLFFFDDDVEVLKGTLDEMFRLITTSEVGFVGGKEIVVPETIKRSSFRNTLVAFIALFQREDLKYQIKKKYVGKINKNSFMLTNFSLDSIDPVQVDTVRGCIWGCRKEVFYKAGGFDENFQGTALREETDLYLRIKALGLRGMYTSQARVLHYRQAGGCDNLAKSYSSFLSKLENEFYFQQKHFKDINRVWFFLRLLPLALEETKNTCGISILLLLQYTLKKSLFN